MSAALPTTDACCIPTCEDVVVQNVPGPTGSAGADGADGADGTSAVTTLTLAYTMPAELGSAQATVGSTAGLVIGEPVFVQSLGVMEVTAIGSAVLVTLKNLEDAATLAYGDNAAPGTIAPIGSRIGPTGWQGESGLLSGGAAGGQLKGTYPNPNLAIPNALGAIAVGNGTDAVSLAAGTAGYIPVSDATAFPASGIGYVKVVPITGDSDVADNRVPRLNGATGTPIPLQASKVEINDNGAITAVGSGGNTRGANAVDLQVTRAAVTQVASGARSFIGAGQNNSALGTESVVAGGEDNTAGAVGQNHSTVAGGSGNSATGQEAFVGGGQDNVASNTQSTICGGDSNTADGEEAFIGGGRSNSAHSPDSAIGGGVGNVTQAGQANAFIGAGAQNTVNGNYGVIGGGASNTISEDYCCIPGGGPAATDKWGQRAYSNGLFSVAGDCQQSDLIWRVTTTDATANVEAFLNGVTATKRAIIGTNRTWAFEILVTARASTGVSAAWTVLGAIQNTGGATALVTAVTTTVIADGTGGTWGLAGNLVVDADNANDALRVRVTGAAATTIRWGIHGRLMEVAH